MLLVNLDRENGPKITLISSVVDCTLKGQIQLPHPVFDQVLDAEHHRHWQVSLVQAIDHVHHRNRP